MVSSSSYSLALLLPSSSQVSVRHLLFFFGTAFFGVLLLFSCAVSASFAFSRASSAMSSRANASAASSATKKDTEAATSSAICSVSSGICKPSRTQFSCTLAVSTTSAFSITGFQRTRFCTAAAKACLNNISSRK